MYIYHLSGIRSFETNQLPCFRVEGSRYTYSLRIKMEKSTLGTLLPSKVPYPDMMAQLCGWVKLWLIILQTLTKFTIKGGLLL